MSRSACNSRAAADSQPARGHGPIITPRAVLAAALLGLFPATALAGSGELPSLIRDIGLCLVLAGVLAIVFTRLRIPEVAAFLVAGIIAGPVGTGLVTDPANIETISELGLILLLVCAWFTMPAGGGRIVTGFVIAALGQGDLVVILAGYKDRMDTFFQSNPGLSSRIAHHIDFPDYSVDELLAGLPEVGLVEVSFDSPPDQWSIDESPRIRSLVVGVGHPGRSLPFEQSFENGDRGMERRVGGPPDILTIPPTIRHGRADEELRDRIGSSIRTIPV